SFDIALYLEESYPERPSLFNGEGGKALSRMVLQELKTQFRSDLDQTVLTSKPLVVGARYDKNPEVFKPDGSVDFSNTDKCP
ncbi:hypothetical protein ACC790_38260, partial [Rhizobium johnstonii]